MCIKARASARAFVYKMGENKHIVYRINIGGSEL